MRNRDLVTDTPAFHSSREPFEHVGAARRLLGQLDDSLTHVSLQRLTGIPRLAAG